LEAGSWSAGFRFQRLEMRQFKPFRKAWISGLAIQFALRV
jgi:hypothetical protein